MILKFKEYVEKETIEAELNENEGGGVAMANAGNVSGMGNVVAAQPSSVPGAVVTGDGTTGSGDVGFPLGAINRNLNTSISKKVKKKTNSKKKPKTIGNEIKSDVMSWQDFVKYSLNKVTKL